VAGKTIAAEFWEANPGQVVDTLLVFLHGGTFMTRDLDVLPLLMEQIHSANLSAAVLVPHYTLPHTRPFPAPLDDICEVLRWTVKRRQQLHWSGRQLVLGGVEAGGNLAAAAALANRDRRGPALAAQILLTPMLDTTLSSASMRAVAHDDLAIRLAHGYRRYLPDATQRMHPYASPLEATRLAGLPPTLVVNVEGSPLHDEGRIYASRLAAAGVPTVSLAFKRAGAGGFTRAALSGLSVGDAFRLLLAVPPAKHSSLPTDR
jgi:acetyl esterase/lipase